MEELERQLKMKQFIRKKFQDNHEKRIHQLEDILAKQGMSRRDISNWSLKRKWEAELESVKSTSFSNSEYHSMHYSHIHSTSLKLEKIESDFYKIISNPKKGKRKILHNSVTEHPLKKGQSSTFMAVLNAITTFILSTVVYVFLSYIIHRFSEEVIFTSFQTSFFGLAVIPFITVLTYLFSKGKAFYVIIPMIIWLKLLIPYILDLNSELVALRTTDFEPATCLVSTGETYTEYPCIYLDELKSPIRPRVASVNVNIDDIAVVKLKYHVHTQHWQDLEFEMVE